MDDIDGSIMPLVAAVVSGTDSSSFYSVLIIFLLVIVNGFFSASEMAVVSLNNVKIRKMMEDGDAFAQKVLFFIEDKGNFFATIQVGVTFAGFLSSAFAASTFSAKLYSVFDPYGLYPCLLSVSTVLITLIISFVSLIFGELVPKQLALSNPERFCRYFVSLLRFFDYAFKPLTVLLKLSSHLVLRLLGIKADANIERITEDEILYMVEASEQSGDIHAEEVLMINNVFAFNDKDVSEIMTPRTGILAIRHTASYDEVYEIVASSRYSRFPVYEKDLDEIAGVLYLKDLLRVPVSMRGAEFDLTKVVREPYYVPESKSVNVLFRELQRQRVSLAIVVDEYGGTAGLITVEDLLEELVGEIEDEYDDPNRPVFQNEDGSWSIDGRQSPQEVGNIIPTLGEMEDDDAYDTIAGFVLSLLQRIPEPDERPSVIFKDLRFTVTEMDDRRIARLKLEIMPEPIEALVSHNSAHNDD